MIPDRYLMDKSGMTSRSVASLLSENKKNTNSAHIWVVISLYNVIDGSQDVVKRYSRNGVNLFAMPHERPQFDFPCHCNLGRDCG